MINTYTELDATTAEQYGRDMVGEQGRLVLLRDRWHLSVRRTADLLNTAGQVIKRWEENPSAAPRMHASTAIALGRLVDHLDQVEERLQAYGITPRDLIPIGVIANRMGLSPTSTRITEKCRTGQITCYELGRLGIYIPREQAEPSLWRDR